MRERKDALALAAPPLPSPPPTPAVGKWQLTRHARASLPCARARRPQGSDAVLMAYKKQLKAKFGTKPGKEAEDATATIFQTTYESTSQAPMVMSS